MIAGKQRAFLQKREAQMIGAMPGRGDGLDRVAGALPSLAVGENRVWRIVAVMCGIEAGRPVAAGVNGAAPITRAPVAARSFFAPGL